MKPGKSSRDWFFRINDILIAISKIELYLESLTLSQFRKSELTIDAVIRNFEIIGEASRCVSVAIQQTYPQIPWKKMGDMRNFLIHEYFGVDIDTIWHTAKNQLPPLKAQLQEIVIQVTRQS